MHVNKRSLHFRLGLLVMTLAAAALWSGCSLLPAPKSDPTRYYVMGADVPTETPAKVAAGLVVGLRAVEVPAYLAGKAIIVRLHDNEIEYRDFSRWAEPLDAAISLRIADALSRSSDVSRVLTYPFPLEVPRDVDVKLRVLRCEGVLGQDNTAQVSMEVQLLSAGGGDLLASKVLTAPAGNWNGHDYGQLAKLLGEGVNKLADELATLLPSVQ